MPDLATWGVFLAAAFLLAVVPGPGILYVLARTLRGGWREGVESTFGTGVAGMIHTLAAALGISAIFATSAMAFGVVKVAGAAYLVYLGLRTLFEKGEIVEITETTRGGRGAFVQGVITEVLNPKTALFFLAFIPQFIDPSGNVFLQFVLLGSVTTLLTSGVDLVVVSAAGPLSRTLRRNRRLSAGQRIVSGGTLIALGAYVVIDQ